ncbi:LptF/LptG family permease [Labrys monachus]|uniref:Lipopolysaccharide export system permease protein n=1 Tax=Labrys monachus TaxID=217067 RepID=A0ABU0FHY4_9HYPH|nr:LptF/LptG family permease [Labrys monachus]MDQ0394228.1 lipopolysaccharide export system permease protein [Labrys monachus]
MNLISRYIARQFGFAFLVCLVVLTLLAWMVGALREFNVMTAQGQSIIVFLVISSLALPALAVVVAPLALFVAMIWLLTRLNGGSELVVLNAAGLSPARLITPFAGITALAVVGIAAITLYGQPASQHELTAWRAAVGADIVSHFLQEGQFTTMHGITFHIRERQPNGTLLGIFVQDTRSKTQTLTYIAERGQIVDSGSGIFLVLENGSLQRQEGGTAADASIVVFERYAFDLSQLGGDDGDPTYFKPRDRYTGELLAMKLTGPRNLAELGRIRGELVDRFTAPLYPIAFMFVALAALGQARTTRQGRASAIAMAIFGVLVIRIGGFVATQSLSVHSIAGVYIAFAIPLVASLFCFGVIVGWIRLRPPRGLTTWMSDLATRLTTPAVRA